MAVLHRGLINLINNSGTDIPLNKVFLQDVMIAIESNELKHRRPSSKYYKPSSMCCKRQMFYMRLGASVDNTRSSYNGIGMADTGTRRHVAIQEALESMYENGQDWKYIDVGKYLDMKHKQNKCLSTKAADKRGMETHLVNDELHLSFMCDGIVQQISTGKYFLFEFKNQVSFKYANKRKVDTEHISQVSTYCLALDLDQALVLYENRDTCELECPELLEVTDEMKQVQFDKLCEVERCVEKKIPPAGIDNPKICRYCNYKKLCERV